MGWGTFDQPSLNLPPPPPPPPRNVVNNSGHRRGRPFRVKLPDFVFTIILSVNTHCSRQLSGIVLKTLATLRIAASLATQQHRNVFTATWSNNIREHRWYHKLSSGTSSTSPDKTCLRRSAACTVKVTQN